MVSVTKVARSGKQIFETLRKSEQDRLVVLKHNEPAAVMLSIPAFEALMDELDDLRIEAVARRRLRTLNPAKTLTYRKMMNRVGRESRFAVTSPDAPRDCVE